MQQALETISTTDMKSSEGEQRCSALVSGRLATAACAAVVLLVAGCTTGSRGTAETFRLIFNEDKKASPAQVSANRFPQAQLKAPDLSALLVLGYIDNGTQVWYAEDIALFRIDANGMLTATSGLGRDLATRVVGQSPFTRLHKLVEPVKLVREYDWIPGYAVGVTVNSTLSRKGMERVEILGNSLELIRLEEDLSGPGFHEKNIYWADPQTGFIWKSRQHLAAGYGVDLVQLKPYRRAKN